MIIKEINFNNKQYINNFSTFAQIQQFLNNVLMTNIL